MNSHRHFHAHVLQLVVSEYESLGGGGGWVRDCGGFSGCCDRILIGVTVRVEQRPFWVEEWEYIVMASVTAAATFVV